MNATQHNGLIRKSSMTERFTTVPNEFLRNPNLSLKAKGLLSLILSFPSDWKIYKTNLNNYSTDGVDAIRTGWNELKAAGYISEKRVFNEDKTFAGWEYLVADEPVYKRLIPTVEEADMGKSNIGTDIGFSDIGKSDIGKSNTTKKEDTNTDIKNKGPEKKSSGKKEKRVPPTPPTPPPPLPDMGIKKMSIREIAQNHMAMTSHYSKGELEAYKDFFELVDSKFSAVWSEIGRFITPSELNLLTINHGFTKDLWEEVMTDICGSGLLQHHNLFYRIPQFLKTIKKRSNGKSPIPVTGSNKNGQSRFGYLRSMSNAGNQATSG